MAGPTGGGAVASPDHTVCSFSWMRSCDVPPNTIPPRRPLPTGQRLDPFARGLPIPERERALRIDRTLRRRGRGDTRECEDGGPERMDAHRARVYCRHEIHTACHDSRDARRCRTGRRSTRSCAGAAARVSAGDRVMGGRRARRARQGGHGRSHVDRVSRTARRERDRGRHRAGRRLSEPRDGARRAPVCGTGSTRWA